MGELTSMFSVYFCGQPSHVGLFVTEICSGLLVCYCGQWEYALLNHVTRERQTRSDRSTRQLDDQHGQKKLQQDWPMRDSIGAREKGCWEKKNLGGRKQGSKSTTAASICIHYVCVCVRDSFLNVSRGSKLRSMPTCGTAPLYNLTLLWVHTGGWPILQPSVRLVLCASEQTSVLTGKLRGCWHSKGGVFDQWQPPFFPGPTLGLMKERKSFLSCL